MTCPRCSGEQLQDHPGGPLVFRHRLWCPLLPVLDRVQAHEAKNLGAPIEREPNSAEKTLAVYLDPSLATVDYTILASRVTNSIIHRAIKRS